MTGMQSSNRTSGEAQNFGTTDINLENPNPNPHRSIQI